MTYHSPRKQISKRRAIVSPSSHCTVPKQIVARLSPAASEVVFNFLIPYFLVSDCREKHLDKMPRRRLRLLRQCLRFWAVPHQHEPWQFNQQEKSLEVKGIKDQRKREHRHGSCKQISRTNDSRTLSMSFGVPQLVEAPLLGRDHEVVPRVCLLLGGFKPTGGPNNPVNIPKCEHWSWSKSSEEVYM